MSDTYTRAERSRIMAAIPTKNTRPELAVRKICHSLGCRFRVHQRTLPSAPDIVFPGRKKVVFVHGCFWHRHRCKKGRSRPKTHKAFWQTKFDANRKRDQYVLRVLRRQGWKVLIVWECELRNLTKLRSRLRAFLGKSARRVSYSG